MARAAVHPGIPNRVSRSEFVLQRVQPALIGLIDGSMSTLAPIFAVALATHVPRYAFLAGVFPTVRLQASTLSRQEPIFPWLLLHW